MSTCNISVILQWRLGCTVVQVDEAFDDRTQIVSLQACFHERVRSYSNWQHAQQTLTKKREALVKLELASKNEKLPQAQEEVKEVRALYLYCVLKTLRPSIRVQYTDVMKFVVRHVLWSGDTL